ncbi:MAG TPA: M20/M25/M40 family metallo-hydrolase [Bryobacteraceae bacterium]|nr:M20/M25/M40 family metallo-hydrolase [Bryobacteraceae bacterium]
MSSKKFAFLLLAVLPLLASAVDYAAEGKLWWAHIQFLADDRLKGRNIGTPEFQMAADYVSGQFHKLGLKPAGTNGYLQPVKFEARTLVPDESHLTLVRDGKEEPLAFGLDASLSARTDLTPEVEAPMVFVGYGLVIPEAHWDELAGLDLKGKIAVYVNAPGPAEAPGPVKSHLGSAAERWRVLHEAGAIGIATIAANGRGGGAPGRGAPPPSISLADPALSETEGMKVSMTVTPRGADKLFEGTGHTFAEIQGLARENRPLPHFAIPGVLRSQATLKHETLESTNIVGMVPGSGKLKNEYVILSAHLDHVGVGRAVNGDDIYNGAMDDASGIATIIEVARLLKASKVKLKRSVIFLAVTAEEKGELGSRYFAAHPTVPFHQIVADINLDMFLPLYPLKVIEVQGLMESTLGETVKAAAAVDGVEVQVDQEPAENRFIRSDQYSFIRRGVPALAFKFGYLPGSPDETTRKNWVRDRYHKPSDDLSQPVDTAAAAKFDRIILRLMETVANDPTRPSWHADSFFKRFATTQ